MNREIGIVMDPLETVKVAKDSSFAMLLAAQRRGWALRYMTLPDLFLQGERAWGRMAGIRVQDDPRDWFRVVEETTRPLDGLDLILMRKDPPFDMEYVYATYILEQAQIAGTLVVNDPRALRDANEKLFALRFPRCCPPALVTRSRADIRRFLEEHGDIILKPLGGMGGYSVFRVGRGDPNLSVIAETLTAHGSRYCMAQRFIPEITEGDKRILVVDGEPVPYALARIPSPGETRGNLAAGGTGEGRALSEHDRWIAAEVGPELVRRGIYFAGLDVIGDYLTEINVTSPTCIRELDRQYGLDIAGDLLDRLEERLGVQ
jgi:glutathione synthase